MRVLLIFLLISFLQLASFSYPMDDYLVELGEHFLKQDRLDEAEIEFKKALIVNSLNEKAKKYLEDIRQKRTKDISLVFLPKYEIKKRPVPQKLEDIPKKKTDGGKEKEEERVKVPFKDEFRREIEELEEDVVMFRKKVKKPEKKVVKPKKEIMKKADVRKEKEIEKMKRLSEVQLQKEIEDLKKDVAKSRKKLEKIKKVKKREVRVKKEIVKQPKKRIELFEQERKKKKEEQVLLRGEAIAAIGVTSEDFVWKRANWDLNELDWRMRNETAFNARENTYDPAIYNRLKFIIDANNKEGLSFHTNISIDPWSFIGKSQRITIAGEGTTDEAEVELKYWSATGYTINESIYTLQDGGVISLPEIKVRGGGRTDPVILESNFTGSWIGVYFELPELKIHKKFWPLRELWFDYDKDNVALRVFPLGLQDQALTSDDPLGLSNHHIYWEESPWLDKWEPGIYNSGPDDFTAGSFDDELSWFTRDSEGERLTFLRGFSFDWFPHEGSGLTTTFASSKTLWQDYDSFDTLAGALRGKLRLTDGFALGMINTVKLGFRENSLDADNFVLGADFSYQPIFGTKVQAEAATSRSHTDKTTEYKLRKRGNAFQVVFISNNFENDILTKDYHGIYHKGNDLFLKGRLTLTHMDEDFDPGLATYLETRKDMFWSRHLHFREPLKHFSGLYESSLTWDDIKPFRIGDSIDTGRDVISLRLEGQNFLDGKLNSLFDLRNAHDVEGGYIETIARLENTYQATPRLTAKLLAIYHDLPDTTEDIDPFDYDADTGEYLVNYEIGGGDDPTVKTLSLGLQYKFTEWFDAYTIWERTNDYTAAYDDFPRSILNSTSFATMESYGKTYRFKQSSLYSQDLFPLPPYPFYDIYKIGVNFYPIDTLKIYLDWTRNEYEIAGQIDDNINHIGLEIQYTPVEKIILYFKYVYSRWKDLDRMAAGEGVFNESHNNFFFEADWVITESDSLSFQYGAMGKSALSEFLYDPYGGTLSTLDTQHIFRIYYKKKF